VAAYLEQYFLRHQTNIKHDDVVLQQKTKKRSLTHLMKFTSKVPQTNILPYSCSNNNSKVQTKKREWKFQELNFGSGKQNPRRMFLRNKFEERKFGSGYLSHWRTCNHLKKETTSDTPNSVNSFQKEVHAENVLRNNNNNNNNSNHLSQSVSLSQATHATSSNVPYRDMRMDIVEKSENEHIYQMMYHILDSDPKLKSQITPSVDKPPINSDKSLNSRSGRASVSMKDILNH
jgi:hypothetical protein